MERTDLLSVYFKIPNPLISFVLKEFEAILALHPPSSACPQRHHRGVLWAQGHVEVTRASVVGIVAESRAKPQSETTS